jgi:hypothetical protein
MTLTYVKREFCHGRCCGLLKSSSRSIEELVVRADLPSMSLRTKTASAIITGLNASFLQLHRQAIRPVGAFSAVTFAS